MTSQPQPAFRLDVDEERLLRDDAPVPLTNKAFMLLLLFAKNPNRLLTKKLILETLWPGIHVSESLIKEYVHDLRMALGDDSRQPLHIETVRGRGYRFLGGIDVQHRCGGHALPATLRRGAPRLAVLPLENLADGERWSRFCRGINDDLVTDLARHPDIVVMAKGSSFSCGSGHSDARKIGTELGVDYLLEGSVQALEGRLRMNMRLVETDQGHQIWAERYDREVDDLFVVQADIVSRVASALGGFRGEIPQAERKRIGRKKLESLEAYELYLLACELKERCDRTSALEAYELIQKSIAIEPTLARAWLTLGHLCFQIASEGWRDDPERYQAMEREAYLRAVALDPRDAIVVMEVAGQRAIDGDIVEAVSGLERALDLGRNDADLLSLIAKYFATITDDIGKATDIIRRSAEIFGGKTTAYRVNMPRILYFSREFEQVIEATRRAPDLRHVRLFELLAMAQLGRRREAIHLLESFQRRYPNFNRGDFMRDPPVLGPRATTLLLDGFTKLGL